MTVLDRDYSEKRDFIRMPIETKAILNIDGEKKEAACRDLSAKGMLLETTYEVSLGTELTVTVPSQNSEFDSLDAKVEVTRCVPYEDNLFLIGVRIIDML